MTTGQSTAVATISKIKSNIMGTTSFDMQLKGMRKEQDFIVYPVQKDQKDKVILIQSDKRIGKINLETGKGIISESQPNGAYFHHLNFGTTLFELTELDNTALKMHIFVSAGDLVGDAYVLSDNSGAVNIL